jgi:hypothetical protein
VKDGNLNDELHLAEMVSLMGPPPRSFLERSETCRQYWDTEGKFVTVRKVLPVTDKNNGNIIGNWIAATPIPDQSLETRERRLEGKDQELLLTFVRKILRWLPEDRPSAGDIFEDEFLVQA